MHHKFSYELFEKTFKEQFNIRIVQLKRDYQRADQTMVWNDELVFWILPTVWWKHEELKVQGHEIVGRRKFSLKVNLLLR